MILKPTSLLTSTLAVLLLMAAAAVSPARGEGDELKRLLEERSRSVVTIKAVLKSEVSAMGQARDEESRVEVPGVVVDASGLILASNMPFSAERLMRLMGGQRGMFEITITPVDLKVRFEGDDEEHAAFVVATDSDLDLIFIQIEVLGDKRPRPIALAEPGSVAVGDEVLALSRLGEGYDYAPYVQTGRVAGEIRRPRRAWILEGGVSSLGLPVFSRDGSVLGVLTTIPTGVDDEPPGAGFGFMMQMFGSGVGSGPFGTFLVPARTVRALVGPAKERAAELLAERRAAQEE